MIRSSMTKSDQKPIFQHFFYYDYLFRYSSLFPKHHQYNILTFFFFIFETNSNLCDSSRLWNRFAFKINNLDRHWNKNQSTEYTNDSFFGFRFHFHFWFWFSFRVDFFFVLFLFLSLLVCWNKIVLCLMWFFLWASALCTLCQCALCRLCRVFGTVYIPCLRCAC